MGLIADTLNILRPPTGRAVQNRIPFPVSGTSVFMDSPVHGNYQSFARNGYAANEIVYAAVELLASSAGEPHITGRRWRRNSPTARNTDEREERRAAIRDLKNELVSKGIQRPNAALVRNGFVEELPSHPLVQMLNNPNPFMSRAQLWGTVVMDKKLAGNAYLVKARAKGFPDSMPIELWRLRPDRVKVLPDPQKFIAGYEYRVTGTGESVIFQPQDVIHFKTRNPLNDYYGMPPLMVISQRIDIDHYMRNFLRSFFERGGSGPGSILSVKQRLSQEQKDEIRERAKRQFGGNAGFHEWMILDNAETSYTQLGLNRGLRDALPKELNDVIESRIAMIFGIPGSILGLLIGYESSSYANKRADWQVLWDITMAPEMSDLDDVLNLSLTPDFQGIDEVYFDLDDIKALQEDVDKVQERHRKNFQAAGISLEEFRDAIGYDPAKQDGTWYIPSTAAVTKRSRDGSATPELAPPQAPEPAPNGNTPAVAVISEPRCPKCGRRNGANIQEGGSLTCARCRMDFIVLDTPNLLT